MDVQIKFLLLWYGQFLLSFLVGIAPAFYFYRHGVVTRGRASSLLFISLASLCGFLLLPFVVFNTSVLLQKNVTELIYPIAVILIVANIIVIIRNAKLRASLLALRGQWHIIAVLLFGILPLSAFHILWPLMKHQVVMGYAVGNDGAAYFGAIDGLQTTFWAVNKAGLVLSRPLMQYAMAVTAAFWKIDNYFAYGVTTALAASMIAAGLATTFVRLAKIRHRPAAALICFTVAAAIIGVAGTFSTLYYTGTLSQYYGAVPVFFALTLPLVSTRPLRLFFWTLFAYACVITMYTIGNIAVPIALSVTYLGPLAWTSRKRFIFRNYAGAIGVLFLAFTAAIVIYRYELRFIFDWASSRNLAQPYSALRSLVITLGLYSQYDDANSSQVTYLVAAVVALSVVGAANAFLSKDRPARLYIFAPLLITFVFVVFDSKNLMLTKYRAILFPMIAMIPIFALYRGGIIARISAGFGLLAVLTTIVVGLGETRDLYVPLMVERNILVDPEVGNLRTWLLSHYRPGARIYCTDATSERHPFLRSLLRPYEWQPVRSTAVWPEFGYTAQAHPSWIDEYNYDYVLDTDDFHGPVDLRKSNPNSLVYEKRDVFSVYSGKLNNMEFGLEFDIADAKRVSKDPPVSQFSLLTTAAESHLYVIQQGHTAQSVKIGYRFIGDEPAKLKRGYDTVAVFEPTGADKQETKSVSCSSACFERVSQLTLEVHNGRFFVDSVWFE